MYPTAGDGELREELERGELDHTARGEGGKTLLHEAAIANDIDAVLVRPQSALFACLHVHTQLLFLLPCSAGCSGRCIETMSALSINNTPLGPPVEPI